MKKLMIVPLFLLCSAAFAQHVVSVNPRQLTATTLQQPQEVYIAVKNIFYFKPAALPIRSIQLRGAGACRMYKTYIEITPHATGECRLILHMKQGSDREMRLLAKPVLPPATAGKRD